MPQKTSPKLSGVHIKHPKKYQEKTINYLGQTCYISQMSFILAVTLIVVGLAVVPNITSWFTSPDTKLL